MPFPTSTLPHYAPVSGIPYSVRNPNQVSTQPRWRPLASVPLAPAISPQPDYMDRAFGFLVSGVMGYQAGRAMAPSQDEMQGWGLVGGSIAIMWGVTGLGMLGLASIWSR